MRFTDDLRFEKMEYGDNTSFVLLNNDDFSSAEYRLLKKQNLDCFVKCVKMLYNGQVQLYYFTKDFVPIESAINSMSEKDFIEVTKRLLETVLDVRDNSFLSHLNIYLALERIYIDPQDYSVKLIYMPLKNHNGYDDHLFESDIKEVVVKCFVEYQKKCENSALREISSYLSSDKYSLVEIADILATKDWLNSDNFERSDEKSKDSLIHIGKLVSHNQDQQIVLIINKDNYIVGRGSSSDGRITTSGRVGREHCKITKSGNQFWITDLNSLNGTFVNSERVLPDTLHHILNGDSVVIADVEFEFITE